MFVSTGMVWTFGFVRGFFWMARSSRVRRRVHMSLAMVSIASTRSFCWSLIEDGGDGVGNLTVIVGVQAKCC